MNKFWCNHWFFVRSIPVLILQLVMPYSGCPNYRIC